MESGRVIDTNFELPVSLRIRGSIEDVFNAWIDPDIAKEWLCDKMEGHWQPGGSVFWAFGDFRQELRVLAVEPQRRLSFRWRAKGEEPETEVQIDFRDLPGEVGLFLTERKWELSHENVRMALDHACGWENVLCRLKAWIEAGVDRR